MHATPARTLTMGVRNPISKHTPVIANNIAEKTAAAVTLPPRGIYKTPWTMAVTPTITRSNSSAKPGQLPGNVENSLCSVLTLNVMRGVASFDTQIANN
jgi:hypothetical protein